MQHLMGKTQYLTFYDAKLIKKRYYNNIPRVMHSPCQNYKYMHPKIYRICKCPSFATGDDCSELIVNSRFCTAVNQFYAEHTSNTIFLRVGGACTYYIYTDHGGQIRTIFSFYSNRHLHRICKEDKSVEIRYQSDLAASGISFRLSKYPISIKSETHLVIIQSRFPP
uniref:EGF-like domain-containing protein n=1 Tax=Strongyloides venezuelensis TaxID=75913 RepID=A0A0K0FQZ2_STRVS